MQLVIIIMYAMSYVCLSETETFSKHSLMLSTQSPIYF